MTNTPRTGNLTKEEVCKAADAIRERGDNVTQDSVRAECGNRGSTSTINKHLKSWREEHEAIAARIFREVTPEVERHGLDLIAKIAELMGQRANERCVQLEAGYKASMAMKEQELVEACAEADQYHALIAEAEARITELLITINASQVANGQHLEEAKALREKIRDLEANREINLLRIKQEQQQIGSLESKIDQALTSAGHFEGVASRLKEQLSEQNEQLAESSRIIGACEENLIRSDEETVWLQAQIAHLTKRCAGLEMANSVLLDASQICLPKPTRRDPKLAA